mgnify:CR=1 FL=1
MIILKRYSLPQIITIGRMSDGSDAQEILKTGYFVKCKEGYRTFQLNFDHDPADEEILQKYSEKDCIEITEQSELIKNLEQQINDMVYSNGCFAWRCCVMPIWKKNIFVTAIKARMMSEGRTAEDIIQEYVKLSETEKTEILSAL